MSGRNGFQHPGTAHRGSGNRPSASAQQEIHGKAVQIRRNLFYSIRYHECGLQRPLGIKVAWLCPDALTYLERLTLGRVQTQGARGMSTQIIHRVLKNMIPRRFYAMAGLPGVMSMGEEVRADQTHTMLAATKYIEELVAKRSQYRVKLPQRFKSGNHMNIHKGKDEKITERKREQEREEGQIWTDEETTDAPVLPTETEKALRKMDKWAELWLSGTLKEADWRTFEHCLSIPDE